jgi:hypothetical protein
MRRAFERAAQLVGEEIATESVLPQSVGGGCWRGDPVSRYKPKTRSFLAGLFKREQAA